MQKIFGANKRKTSMGVVPQSLGVIYGRDQRKRKQY
jgi:hypothetical protein